MSDLFSSLKISGAGLSVNRRKMNITAENIANAETTKTKNGGPYRKKTLDISGKPEGLDFNRVLRKHTVSMSRTNSAHMSEKKHYSHDDLNIIMPSSREVSASRESVKIVYDPSHPDANVDGFVEMPDINVIIEMVNMMTAARAYEANTTALEASKNIYTAALDI